MLGDCTSWCCAMAMLLLQAGEGYEPSRLPGSGQTAWLYVEGGCWDRVEVQYVRCS